MSFTIEFEPLGIRLVCAEPLTLLEAARQAGIQMRSDCGGKGTCGKCLLRITRGKTNPPTPLELQHIPFSQIKEGFRLACRTLVSQDVCIFLPAESLQQEQVLQTEGVAHRFTPNPAIHISSVNLSPPTLKDLKADMQRLQGTLSKQGCPPLQASLPVISQVSHLLHKHDWQIALVHNQNEMLQGLAPGDHARIGLAVDVGSTKLACYLVNLETGQTLAARGLPNPQISFGEDIMSRLGAVLEDAQNAIVLQGQVIQSINHATQEMCTVLGIQPDAIMDACLVGNTAMHHLFLSLPVEPLAMSPFAPVTSAELQPLACELGLHVMPGARVYAPPVIAGFVGSDHLAFLLSSGFGQDKRIRLGIDIGTNTEIALQAQGRIVSVSTASGPAFEGAHIHFGMRAAPGAIEHVTIGENGIAQCQVIGSRPPVGICGSGILDAVAELRRTGLINQRARLEKESPSVLCDEDNKPYFVLIPKSANQREISINQKDIDQILLAKGAIRAGIDILMDYLKIRAAEIEEVVIAGAFGSYMNPEHAIRLGMLPQVELNRIRAVGNAAGVGARLILASVQMRRRALALSQKIEYLELTVYPDFNLFFANGIKS